MLPSIVGSGSSDFISGLYVVICKLVMAFSSNVVVEFDVKTCIERVEGSNEFVIYSFNLQLFSTVHILTVC